MLKPLAVAMLEIPKMSLTTLEELDTSSIVTRRSIRDKPCASRERYGFEWRSKSLEKAKPNPLVEYGAYPLPSGLSNDR